jgi:[ribosomal protein S5]-alanine N-acetyltransferase
MLPQLETPRLVLRELCIDDALALQAFQTRPSYLRCQAMEPADFNDGVQRVKCYLQYRGEGERRRLYDFVARLRSERQVVGHGSLSRSAPGIASLGLGIDEVYTGRGLATEIALRLLAFGFNELKLHRIEAEVALENAACIRVLENRHVPRRRGARLHFRARTMVDGSQIRDARARPCGLRVHG